MPDSLLFIKYTEEEFLKSICCKIAYNKTPISA